MRNKNLCKWLVSNFVLLVLLGILVSGCGVSVDPRTYSKNTETPPDIPTLIRKTATAIHPTPSPTAAHTYFDYKKVCLPITSPSESGDKSSGLILGEVSSEAPRQKVSLLDLSNQTEIRLFSETEKITGLRVSPDNFWIAYLAPNDQILGSKLIFRNLAADKIIEMTWEEDWSIAGMQRWINNQTILVEKNSLEYPAPIVAINPFTNEILSKPVTFPNQVTKSPNSDLSLAEYSPIFDYVIYPASKDGQVGYMLKKTETLETISFTPSQTLATFSPPTWNHAGTEFIMSVKPFNDDYTFELGFGNITGRVEQITSLSDFFNSYYISDIVWSPDDMYVAFIVDDISDMNNQVERLMILDIASRKILDVCVNVNYKNWSEEFSDVDSPVWSPSSKELIVEKQFDYGKNDVFLINLSKMQVTLFEKNKRILGWIKLTK